MVFFSLNISFCQRIFFYFSGGSSCPSSAPSTLWYLREHRRLVGGTAAGGNGALPASLAPELLWMVQRDPGNGNGDDNDDADDSAAKKGTAMMDLIGHTLTAQERGRSATAAAAPVVADGDGNRSRQEAPVPPWLLLAMVSAAHSQERRGLSAADPSEAAGAVLEGPPSRSRGGGDPATAAVEGGVRSALEWRVAESLRSLSNVRALLQDPVAAAAAAERAGSTSRSIADDEAARKLEALTAAVDPATALFEGTLREWLACRRSGKKEGGELYSGDAWAGESVNLAGGGRGGGGELCGPGSERAAAAVAVDGGGSRTMPDNALALAFRCEAAGVREAMVSAIRIVFRGRFWLSFFVHTLTGPVCSFHRVYFVFVCLRVCDYLCASTPLIFPRTKGRARAI